MLRRLAAAYRKSFSGLPAPVWLLAFVAFVNRSGSMVMTFLVLYLTEVKGWSVTEAGAILGVYGTGALGGAYIGGRLSDLLTSRRVMELSLVLTGAGFLLLGTLDDPAAITLAALAIGIVEPALRPANATALAEYSRPSHRGRAFALNRLAVNLGLTFGPAAGGFLALIDYRWLFVVDGGTCLLAAALLSLTLGRYRPLAHESSHAASGRGRAPWHDGPFLALLFLHMLLAAVIFQTFSTWPLYLHELHGFSEAQIGLLFSINTILVVACQMPVIHAVEKLDPLRLSGWGSFLFCAGFALLPFGGTYAFVASTVVVWTIGELLSLPLIEGVAAGRASAGSRGRYMGMVTLSFAAAFIVAPIGGTWLYQHTGPDTVWYACGAVGVILLLGFRLLASASRPRSRSASRPPELEGSIPAPAWDFPRKNGTAIDSARVRRPARAIACRERRRSRRHRVRRSRRPHEGPARPPGGSGSLLLHRDGLIFPLR